MKPFVLFILLLWGAHLSAQTLTSKLIGNWQFKQVLDGSGKPLEGTINPLVLDLRKDSTFSLYAKSKKVKGTWAEKDSTLYLKAIPATGSVKETQVMRVLKIENDVLEIYAGAEKGNEVRFVYTRRRKK